MIHIQNIPHILQEGFVHPASMRASRHYVSIGDAAVILKRNNRFIDQVHRISDYIPFYSISDHDPLCSMSYNMEMALFRKFYLEISSIVS